MTGQEGVGVEIAPPPGEALRPHNWTRTDRYPFQTSGRPGLTVRAGNRGCNVATGSVEVLDVGFNAQGAVERLWALFDHHCEGARSSAFGERDARNAAALRRAGWALVIVWEHENVASAADRVESVIRERSR